MTQQRDVDRDEKQGRLVRVAKLVLLGIAILVLLVLALRLVGLGGEHGPGRHGAPDRDEQPSNGHTPPANMHE